MDTLKRDHWSFQSAGRAVISATTFPGAETMNEHLILVHGNGLCKECFYPVVEDLKIRQKTTATIHIYDLRGHGESTTRRIEEFNLHAEAIDQRRTYTVQSLTENFTDGHWWHHVIDLNMLLRHIEARYNENKGRLAFSVVGYSMGGAIVCMAQIMRPSLFKNILLFEPILLPKVPRPTPLAELSAARRPDFPSRAAVKEQLLKKPSSIYRRWDSRALEAYIRFGFRETSPSSSAVTLRCPPAVEAQIFREGDLNGVWELLDTFAATKCVLMKGSASLHLPDVIFDLIKQRVAHHHYIRYDGGDHFVPFTDPTEFANVIHQHLLSHAEDRPQSKL